MKHDVILDNRVHSAPSLGSRVCELFVNTATQNDLNATIWKSLFGRSAHNQWWRDTSRHDFILRRHKEKVATWNHWPVVTLTMKCSCVMEEETLWFPVLGHWHLLSPFLWSRGSFPWAGQLVEGGRLGPMTTGTEYREVRQYRFLTRIYSPYMESTLEDFRQGLKPDVIIISSCVWDITR